MVNVLWLLVKGYREVGKSNEENFLQGLPAFNCLSKALIDRNSAVPFFFPCADIHQYMFRFSNKLGAQFFRKSVY